MRYQLFLRQLLAILLFCGLPLFADADNLDLPEIGSTTSAIISVEQERVLGQAWLRSFRNRANITEDYLLQEYVEKLIFSMLPHAGLADNRVDVLVVHNPSLNAFAVPGGIVGVHTGLFLHAQTEDQLSAVLAHELAHLSQRHFARSVRNQRSSAVTAMAGLLAGVILAATAGGDAGLAVISATQAASLESQLKYSRQNEQEADRLGLELLSKTGRDPAQMTEMFEQMLKNTRYVGYRVPEYLRSHPLTENRINDAANRARQYPKRDYPQNPQYELMQVRIEVNMATSPQLSVREREAEFKTDPTDANRYGLALAYSKALMLEKALVEAKTLFDSEPASLPYLLLYADLLGQTGEAEIAERLILDQLKFRPNAYALNMSLAKTYTHQTKYSEAAEVYKFQTVRRPNDALVWYEYAEALGLAGKILELHKARAQYFMLTGAYQRAIRQLQYAKREVEGNAVELAILDQKISEAARLMSQSEF